MSKTLNDRFVRRSSRVVCFFDAGDNEDFVVHRHPKQEGEDQQRHEVRDDSGSRNAPDGMGPVAVLPNQHECSVGRANREQVEHDGLERQDHGSKARISARRPIRATTATINGNRE